MIIETNDFMKSKTKTAKKAKKPNYKLSLYLSPELEERLSSMEKSRGIKDTTIAIVGLDKYLTENGF